jgi:hypothetical protein
MISIAGIAGEYYSSAGITGESYSSVASVESKLEATQIVHNYYGPVTNSYA